MSHFPPTSRRLSDGLVLPRVPADNHNADVEDTMTPYYWSRRTASPLVSLHHESKFEGEASAALLSLTGVTVDRPLQLQISAKANETPRLIEDDIKKRHKRKRAEISKSRRREQCRANQARYRDKQKNTELALEKSVEHLHQELEILKRRYRDVSSHERSNQSPWLIAAEVFRLIETGFRSPWSISSIQEMKNHTTTQQIVVSLERAFAHDVAMTRIDALMDQLRLYSDYFDKSNLQLERIELVGPVLSAQAKLSVTVTEFTLQYLFPHLEEPAREHQVEAGREHLYQRLLGQRLECSCLMTFLFDKDSYHVVRLATTIDLMPALLRVWGV
ncbi:unnamed protein product [Peronospora destructor]|uniref:BZIP domain-containing protein n=1 Tax=Peronospora destructor TaxID=86335 RepID=A0AAV0UZ40_9STRA|nr:unnamed protein product [Peronospora destructor]